MNYTKPHPIGCTSSPNLVSVPDGIIKRLKFRRACRKRGGHWWHPEPGALIDWFCCQCGALRDGMPKDGT